MVVENKLNDLKLEKNGAELAFEIKIIVLNLQRVQEDMSPYILISRRPQTNNENKKISALSNMLAPMYVRAWRICGF